MIDVDRLGSWMDEVGLAGKGEEIEQRYLSGGSQNEIYEIRRGELHGAVRIPPPSAPESRDAGILREWRIIEALEGTDVPHTAAIAVCPDSDVLGRTFYLMGFVDGWSPMETGRQWPEPFHSDLDARKGLAYQLVEGIALLGSVDWRAKGLEDLGRPDGFHDRQVDRWTAFLNRIKGRELPGFDIAAGWLRADRPIDFIPGLMHGDYQFANVMFKNGAPAPGRHRRLGDGHGGRPEARSGAGRPVVAGGHERPVPVGRGVRGSVRPSHPGRARAALRQGLGPPGGRPRLLRDPGQVEAGGGARAGSTSGRAQTTRSFRPSGRSSST